MSPVRPKEYLFDHLVVMGRDSLNELSELFQDKGFHLTPLAHHNLGSSNRLIMLDSTYIELLGWEKGKQIQRAEIASQAIGLDALVFRTNDAQACYEQLKASGFAVNPVQDLSREGEFMGNTVLVEFKNANALGVAFGGEGGYVDGVASVRLAFAQPGPGLAHRDLAQVARL